MNHETSLYRAEIRWLMPGLQSVTTDLF